MPTTDDPAEHTGDQVHVISSGSLALDRALRRWGLPPRGRRVSEVSGPERSGKTPLFLELMVMDPRLGSADAFPDAEQALDLGYVETVVIDLAPDDGDDSAEARSS